MKTALITGVSRGIGKALAEKFLAEGYSVVGTTQTGTADITDTDLKLFKLDLADPGSIRECATAIQASGARIDILVNNAGVMLDSEETVLDPTILRRTFEVNVIGTADLTERLIGSMNAGGHILFLSSTAGSLTDMDDVSTSHFPYHYPAYKISKAALNMYMRTLAERLEHDGSSVIVSSVHPGWVRTDMGGDSAPVLPEEAAEDIFKLAASKPRTGYFWYKGERCPW